MKRIKKKKKGHEYETTKGEKTKGKSWEKKQTGIGNPPVI